MSFSCRLPSYVLLERLPGLRLDERSHPIELRGWEFRRPLQLNVRRDI